MAEKQYLDSWMAGWPKTQVGWGGGEMSIKNMKFNGMEIYQFGKILISGQEDHPRKDKYTDYFLTINGFEQ